MARDKTLSEQAFEQFPQALWVADPQGTITYANRLWREFTGLTPEQTAESGWASLIHPEDRPRALASWRKLIATGVGEAAIAVNAAKHYIDPTQRLQPVHSTTLFEKKPAAHAAEAAV